MFRKKCLLLIGGSGQLGTKTIEKFTLGPRLRRWKVFNIDKVENPAAQANYIIDPSKPITAEIISDLHEKLEAFDVEFEAIINTAGHYYIPNEPRILEKLHSMHKGIIRNDDGKLVHP